MSLVLTLDPDNPTPPYEQLRRQLADLITAGQLGPGDRLPPLRQLAGDLGVAVGTVARAYRELEHAGVVTTRGRAGTVVNGDGADRASKEAARSYADAMRALGVWQDEALDLVRRAFDRPVTS